MEFIRLTTGLGFTVLPIPDGPHITPLWYWVPKGHACCGFGGPNSIIVIHLDSFGSEIYTVM